MKIWEHLGLISYKFTLIIDYSKISEFEIKGLICFTSSSHWIRSLNCGDRMWHFCVCFGQCPACSAGCWDAALRSRPGSGAPVLTPVSQTWCVVEMRIVEYLFYFVPRPMSLTCCVGRAIRGVRAPAAAPSDGSGPMSAHCAAQQRRKPSSLDQKSRSIWDSVLWRDPCLFESIVTPLVERRPPALCAGGWGSMPAAALQAHSVGLAQ